MKNDRFKNHLCERFEHPLLRINSNYINREYRGIDLLSYFIDVWFLEQAFYEAQESGLLPYDEIFDECSILYNGSGRNWPYCISSDLIAKIIDFHSSGKINQPFVSNWIGVDNEHNYRCICWLEVDKYNVIYITTGMRKQLFPAVDIGGLLGMLAMFDIFRQLEQYFDGQINPLHIDVFNEKLNMFCSNLEPRSSSGIIQPPLL